MWVRPDKVANAIGKLNAGIGKHHFTIHVSNSPSGEVMYRAIRMGDHINDSISNGSIKVITPSIRGIREKYLEKSLVIVVLGESARDLNQR